MQADSDKKAEALFVEKQHYRGLSERCDDKSLIFNDIVRLARGDVMTDSQALMTKVNQSLPARKQYMALSQQFSFDVSLMQAAASTDDEWHARITDKFTLKFKQDTQDDAQVFALLTIFSPTQSHCANGVVLNVEHEDSISRIEFPLVDDGKTQRLFDVSSDELIALSDSKATIVLV